MIVRHTQRRCVLKREDWAASMKAVYGRADKSPAEAMASLRELLARTDLAQAAFVSTWHVRESRTLLAHLEHECGTRSTAADLYEQAAREAHAEYRGAKLAAAWRFAEAALIRFEMGDSQRALALSAEAFSLADLHLDPSLTFDRLLAEVRKHRNVEAEDGGA